jgi:hypothetical protein
VRVPWIACGVVTLMAGGFVRAASAEPKPLPARVLWAHDGALYVAADDTTALVPGMTLELLRGRRRLATATVTRRLDGHVAVARLESGSLDRERRLERLQLRGEAPPVARMPNLRLGLPGRGRTSLLFRCASTGVETRFAGAEYRVDTLRAGALRLLRVAPIGTTNSATAPDTMLVRFFSDAADQEIALERGELDVAVFWPGELSPHMRADPRWREPARGLRARGVIVAMLPARDTLGIPGAAPAALDREAFAGDLLPWSELEPTATSASAPVGWQVDPALPGARLLERILGRASSPTATRLARLTWLDVPVAARDAVQATWRGPGVQPLFALRCPVLASPAFRPALEAPGVADLFANLLRCETGTP